MQRKASPLAAMIHFAFFFCILCWSHIVTGQTPEAAAAAVAAAAPVTSATTATAAVAAPVTSTTKTEEIISTGSPDKRIPALSFEPPYKEVDNAGQRMVAWSFRVSGSTQVNTNFARVTPELQSKVGAIWSRDSVGFPSFTSILKFRISGRGKDFFGDGMALWLVQQGYWLEGPVHGFQQEFIGVGIIFDTFKNTENLISHRDVTVLINDGEKTMEMMTKDVQGCNILARYHSERADFKVTDVSLVKVIVDNRDLRVLVDATNSGKWEECVSLKDIPLPANWGRDAHLGVTASTGQLVDNHDVISLVTYADTAVVESVERERLDGKQQFPLMTDASPETRLSRLEAAVNRLLNRLDYDEHHTEHHLASLTDHIDNVRQRLDKKEHSVEDKMKEIDVLVKKHVDDHVHHKVDGLDAKIDRKLSSPEWRKAGSRAGAAGGAGGGDAYKWPFFILALLFVAALGVAVFFYQKLVRKMHLP